MEITSLPFEELEKERARLKTLHSQNILDTEYEEDFDQIVRVASYVCGSPISLVSLVDTDRQWFKAKVGLGLSETPRSMSFCSHAIQQEGIMEIPDATQDARFKDNPLVTGDPNIKFYAGAPLVARNGYKLGTLCVIDSVSKTLSQEQKECLVALSDQIMAQVELRQHRSKLQELNSGLIVELENKIETQSKVLHLFGRFVPQAIVAKHLQAGDGDFDDAEAKNLTVLFSDIRGYTSVVEKLSPNDAVAILRVYYSTLSDVIGGYNGMVNQYVGDEIFAIFGDAFSMPGHEKDAVFCALEMLDKLKLVNEQCEGITPVPIKVGIGIHSGEVVTGTLGSRSKIEYSVTGDVVNTGKRIESLTREYPNTILISEPVYDKVKEDVEVRPWPSCEAKGKSDPLKVFQVLRRKDRSG